MWVKMQQMNSLEMNLRSFDRTCDTCNKHTFDSIVSAIDCISWNTNYIIEALSGELENQNRHYDFIIKQNNVLL